MKPLLFFLIAILLSSLTAFAQKQISGNDPINLNDFKHPQQYFLDTYGKR